MLPHLIDFSGDVNIVFLDLGNLGNHIFIFLFEILVSDLQLLGFPGKPINIIAQMGQVVFNAVGISLGFVFLCLLGGDFLCFLMPFEFDFFNGSIKSLQL